jgi:hypothetical protein
MLSSDNGSIRVASDCRVHRFEGWIGSDQKAHIDLKYDGNGRLLEAIRRRQLDARRRPQG